MSLVDGFVVVIWITSTCYLVWIAKKADDRLAKEIADCYIKGREEE